MFHSKDKRIIKLKNGCIAIVERVKNDVNGNSRGKIEIFDHDGNCLDKKTYQAYSAEDVVEKYLINKKQVIFSKKDLPKEIRDKLLYLK